MIKKTLFIIFFLLQFSNIVNAKLSDEAWNEMFNGCYYSGVQMKKLKSYCACYTNKFNANFSDETVLKFIETTGDLSKHPTVEKWARQCYDKYK